MSLTVRASSDNDGVMIVALAGSADTAPLSPLHPPLAAALADTPLVILALEESAGIDVDELRTLIIGLLDEARGGELRIATRDPDLRRALAAARIHHLVAVHETVADAADPRTRDPDPLREAGLVGDPPDGGQGFTVASSAIPLAVHCRGCGRLLLPARLWPLTVRSRPDGYTELELRCVRCHAVGSLVLDPDQADHRALLTMWTDERSDRASSPQSSDTRSST